MTITILQLVFNILVGALGALIGAFFTLRQFRLERGFDRRIKWYEDVISANEQLAKACMNVASLFSEDRKPNSKMIWNILGPPHNRYLEVLPHAIFYAPRKTYEGLGQTTRITGAIHDSFSKNLEATEIANHLNKISRLLIMANAILANEMRTQLGLGKIKQPAWAEKLQGQVDA